MKLTIRELAKKADVSVMTISRAVNPDTRAKVAPKTLKKIEKLIEKYGYTPNIAARNLRQTKTKTIGVVFPYVPGLFFSSYYNFILAGIADYLRDSVYQFKLLLLNDKRSWDQYDFKTGERVDGLIISHWFKMFKNKYIFEKLQIPSIVLNDFDKTVKTFYVGVDQKVGGQIAASYLYEKGHRNIAIITGPRWSRDSLLRIDGFRKYMKKKEVIIHPDLILDGNFLEEVVYEKIDQLLNQPRKFSAVFCCNDQMAVGAIKRLKERGVSCPKDISVMGFDNDPYLAHYNEPAITTINVPAYDFAQKAIKILIDHLEDPDCSDRLTGHSLLSLHLVERSSVEKII